MLLISDSELFFPIPTFIGQPCIIWLNREWKGDGDRWDEWIDRWIIVEITDDTDR